MTFKEFVNDFRKGLTGDVLFFYGAEDYLMEWAAAQVADKYVDPQWRNLDLRTLDGETANAFDIMARERKWES